MRSLIYHNKQYFYTLEKGVYMAKRKEETVVRHRELNPVASALLNFILWGTGYIYNGSRIVFGILMLISMIILHSPLFYLGIRWYFAFPGLLIILGHVIISLALAYDAYNDTKS